MTDIVVRQPITLELSAVESLYVLDAVNERAARAWENVRKCAPGSEERAGCETAAGLLDRVARRLDGQLYRVCRFVSDTDCTAPVTWFDDRGVPYCQAHSVLRRRIDEALWPGAGL